jgi:hypothetical protein
MLEDLSKKLKDFGRKNKKWINISMAIIGVVILILIPIVYSCVLSEMLIPSDFKYENTGSCRFWMLLKGEERFDATYLYKVDELDKGDKEAVIYRTFINKKTGEPVMDMKEWVHVDARLNNLQYTRVPGGYFGIPGTGIPGSPIHEGDSLFASEVGSNGVKGGEENIQIEGTLRNTGTDVINGLKVWIWEGSDDNKSCHIHGMHFYITQTVKIAIEPVSGYIVKIERHQLFYMRPRDMLKVGLEELFKSAEGKFPRLDREGILNIKIHVATLDFETNDRSMNECVDEAKSSKMLIQFMNPWLGIIMGMAGVSLIGIAYWKRK